MRGIAMQFRHHMTALRLFLPLALALAGGAQAAGLEAAPLFAGYERGCNLAKAAAERLIVWANPDAKGRLAATDALPAPWRAHAGTPVVADRQDHWHVTLPLRGVRFHGLPVSRLERWYGKGSGISGWSLRLAAPLAEARRRIDPRRFRPGEGEFLDEFMPELIADEDDARFSQLVCDVSM